jgi:hypothetical protein
MDEYSVGSELNRAKVLHIALFVNAEAAVAFLAAKESPAHHDVHHDDGPKSQKIGTRTTKSERRLLFASGASTGVRTNDAESVQYDCSRRRADSLHGILDRARARCMVIFPHPLHDYGRGAVEKKPRRDDRASSRTLSELSVNEAAN